MVPIFQYFNALYTHFFACMCMFWGKWHWFMNPLRPIQYSCSLCLYFSSCSFVHFQCSTTTNCIRLPLCWFLLLHFQVASLDFSIVQSFDPFTSKNWTVVCLFFRVVFVSWQQQRHYCRWQRRRSCRREPKEEEKKQLCVYST